MNPLGFGIIDAGIGTLATIIGIVGLLIFRKKPLIGLLFPVLANGVLVSVMLIYIMGIDIPLWLSFLTISFGQAAVLYGLGVPLYYYLKHRSDITEKLN